MSGDHAKLQAGMQISKGVSLLEPLGAGGMGAVWLADHHGLKTRVVVKFMLGELGASEHARLRFSREAAAAAQVKSPHVVQMLDHGVSDDGIPFIVMEHLEGHDLGHEIETGGPVDPVKVITVVNQVAKALTKVHAAGLLHRDIKPDNIFLVDGEEDVFVKVLDFGIAKSAHADDGPLDGQTKTGQVVGTPFYMSPEQVTAQKNIDFRSDLWALGVVAYEALTGKRPFDGPSFGALAVKIATESAPRPSEANPALPVAVDAWFAKACAREPGGRFVSARELADAFRAAFEGVMSVPAFSGDSGQRSASSRGSVPDGNTGPRVATLGLAATALDDSDDARKNAALARSEAGVSVADRADRRSRGSTTIIAGGAFAIAAIAVVAVVGLRKAPHEAGIQPQPVTASIASSAPVVAEVAPVASSAAPVTPPPPAVSPSASASVSVSASAHAAAHSHGGGRSAPVPAHTPPVAKSAEGAKPTPRPAGSEPPDLF